MGIDLNQHRATIWAFNARTGGPKQSIRTEGDITPKLWVKVLLLQYLLAVCMDVHSHPGPDTLQDNVKMCHLNIQSLNAENRLDSCIQQLANQYDIITMSETWLDGEDNNVDYDIPGYTGPYRWDRTLQRGGGVLAWIRNNIVVKPRPEFQQDKLELLWLELKIPKSRLLLAIC